MLGRGHGIVRMRQRGVVDELLVLARLDGGAHRSIKRLVGRSALRVVPLDLAQVVHHIARPQHHKPLVAQRCQLLSQVIGVLSVCQLIHREFDHRDVGLRKHVMQRSPHAMIDAPGIVHGHGVSKQLLHAGGEAGVTRRMVLNRIELGGKAVHVVHLTWSGVALYQRPRRIPVGRHSENSQGLVRQDSLAHSPQAVCHLIVPQRHHRVAVTHKQCHLPLLTHRVPPGNQ